MNWSDYFFYSGGNLVWKNRPRDHFPTSRGHKIFNANFAGKSCGCSYKPAKSSISYLRCVVLGKYYLAHRIVWEMFNGKINQDMEIDHIDGNGENNLILNLRIVSSTENHKNRPTYKNNSSGTSGVSFDKRAKAWIARASINGKRVVVYRGPSVDEASAAQKKAQSNSGYHKNHGRLST